MRRMWVLCGFCVGLLWACVSAQAAPSADNTLDMASVTLGIATTQRISVSLPASDSSSVTNLMLTVATPSGGRLLSATGSKGNLTWPGVTYTYNDASGAKSGQTPPLIIPIVIPIPAADGAGKYNVPVGQLDPGGNVATLTYRWQF